MARLRLYLAEPMDVVYEGTIGPATGDIEPEPLDLPAGAYVYVGTGTPRLACYFLADTPEPNQFYAELVGTIDGDRFTGFTDAVRRVCTAEQGWEIRDERTDATDNKRLLSALDEVRPIESERLTEALAGVPSLTADRARDALEMLVASDRPLYLEASDYDTCVAVVKWFASEIDLEQNLVITQGRGAAANAVKRLDDVAVVCIQDRSAAGVQLAQPDEIDAEVGEMIEEIVTAKAETIGDNLRTLAETEALSFEEKLDRLGKARSILDGEKRASLDTINAVARETDADRERAGVAGGRGEGDGGSGSEFTDLAFRDDRLVAVFGAVEQLRRNSLVPEDRAEAVFEEQLAALDDYERQLRSHNRQELLEDLSRLIREIDEDPDLDARETYRRLRQARRFLEGDGAADTLGDQRLEVLRDHADRLDRSTADGSLRGRLGRWVGVAAAVARGVVSRTPLRYLISWEADGGSSERAVEGVKETLAARLDELESDVIEQAAEAWVDEAMADLGDLADLLGRDREELRRTAGTELLARLHDRDLVDRTRSDWLRLAALVLVGVVVGLLLARYLPPLPAIPFI